MVKRGYLAFVALFAQFCEPGVVALQWRDAPINWPQVGENALCSLTALQNASEHWLAGRLMALIGNPCVNQEELLKQHKDRWEMKRHRKQFSATASMTSSCTKVLLPKMVYLGQGHTGSTTLAMQLDAHPELSYGWVKEHHWGERLFSGNGHLGDYKSQFRVPCRTHVTMDFSPGEYLDGHHGSHWHAWSQRTEWLPWLVKENNSAIVSPEIMRSVLGNDTKLIIMLRDPVDFLDSLPPWWRKHAEDVRADCYAIGVEKWLKAFPKDNVLVVQAEKYFRNAQATLDRIFEFVGVKQWTYPYDIPHSGRRRNPHVLATAARRAYHADDYNRNCKSKLQEMTGMKFEWPGSD